MGHLGQVSTQRQPKEGFIVAEAGDEVVGFLYAARCSLVPANASKATVPVAPPILLDGESPCKGVKPRASAVRYFREAIKL